MAKYVKINGTKLDDVITGGALNAKIKGKAGNDTINGGAGNDKIKGNDGDDTIKGGAGNDDIDGGKGTDIAVYTGSYQQYVLDLSHNGDLKGTVKDLTANRDGTDTLKKVEFLQFSDAIYDVENDTFFVLNQVPQTNAATGSGNEDTTIAVSLSGTDGDGTVASFRITSLPANGTLYSDALLTQVLAVNDTVTATGNAAIVYFEPAADFNGPTSFQYAAIDNNGAQDATPATASISVASVNDVAETNNTSASGDEDTTIAVSLSGTDGDGTVASFRITSLPANGTLYSDALLTQVLAVNDTVTATGNAATVYFKPAADFNGPTSFQYAAIDNDGAQDASPANASISVASVNDVATIGGTSTGSVQEDVDVVSGNLHASGGLTISDPDSGESNFQPQTVAGSNGYGTFTLDAVGHWTYTASAAQAAIQDLAFDDFLTDSFTAVSADGTASQVVTVTINGDDELPDSGDQPPVANPDTNAGDLVTEAGVAGAGDATAAGNVLTNDTDPDAGDSKTVQGVAAGIQSGPLSGNVEAAIAGTYGTLSLAADGSYTYTLDNADAGTNGLAQGQAAFDVFSYTMRDAAGLTSTATLSIAVTGANDAPVINVGPDQVVAVGQTATITGTFSDPDLADTPILTFDFFTPTSLNIIDGQFSADFVFGSPDTYSVAMTVTDNHGATAPALVQVTVEEAPDDTAPTVAVDIVDVSLRDGDPSSNVTFTFSEAPVGFTSGDIFTSNGNISGFTQDTATTWHATFTANDNFDGFGSVSVAAGSYTDGVGNSGGGGSGTVDIDRVNPTVAVNIAATSLGDGTPSSDVTFTFSEAPLASFSSSDIVATNGTISGFTHFTASIWHATFTANDNFDGFGSVSVAAGSYTDAAGNSGGAGSDTVDIDRVNPTVAVNIAATSLGDGTPSSDVTFTFSEAPLASFSSSDIVATNGTISGFTHFTASIWHATFTANDNFDGFGSVSVAAGSYTDAAGNSGGAGSGTVDIDRVNPTVAVNIAATSLGDGTPSSDVTFTFSEAPLASFSSSDIVATNGTISGFTHFTASIWHATFTANDNFDGFGSVSVAAGSYTDAAGNSGGAGSDTVDIDRVNPTVAVNIAATLLVDGTWSSDVTFTFSEPVSGFTSSDVAWSNGTMSFQTTNGILHGSFTAHDNFDGFGSVSVAAGSYTDAAGNSGGAGSDTVTIDTENPLVDLSFDPEGPAGIVIFTFTEAVLDFTSADVTTSSGFTLGDFIQDTATTWHAEVIPFTHQTHSGTARVEAGSYTDVFGNLGAGDVVSVFWPV